MPLTLEEFEFPEDTFSPPIESYRKCNCEKCFDSIEESEEFYFYNNMKICKNCKRDIESENR